MRLLTMMVGALLGAVRLGIVPQSVGGEVSITTNPAPDDYDNGKQAAWNKFHKDMASTILEAAERGISPEHLRQSLENLGETAGEDSFFEEGGKLFLEDMQAVAEQYQYEESALPPRTPWQAQSDETNDTANNDGETTADNQQQDRPQQQ